MILPLFAVSASDVSVRDAMVAALAIARPGLAETRRYEPQRQVRLASEDGAFSKADLALLREGLGLSATEPRPKTGTLLITFGPVRRLPNGRLGEDVGFLFPPRGGAKSHYVVNPDKGPFGTVERRTTFIEY